MSNSKVFTGVQQIMIGSKCSNYENALAALRAIKSAGYDGIELNEFMIKPTPVLVRLLTKLAGMPTGNSGKLDWHRLINESRLKVISLHSYLNSIEEDSHAVADEAKIFGTDTVVITGMYRFDYGSEKEVTNLAQRLNKVGKELASYGMKLLYHNHNVELQRTETGKRALDILIDNTDPDYVNFELDTYWLADGGADALSIMRRLGTRMVMWHINDRGCRKKGPFMTPILKEDAAELGYGNMPLEKMLSVAKENGVSSIVLETHKNWIDKDPIKSLQLSSKWLDKMK